MRDETKPQCCHKVWSGAPYYKYYPCERAGKIQRDGGFYCGQHDPVAAKVRDEKREKAYGAKQDANAARHARNSAVHAACDGVPTEQLRKGIVLELIEVAKAAGVWKLMCPAASEEGKGAP